MLPTLLQRLETERHQVRASLRQRVEAEVVTAVERFVAELGLTSALHRGRRLILLLSYEELVLVVATEYYVREALADLLHQQQSNHCRLLFIEEGNAELLDEEPDFTTAGIYLLVQ
jgi:hypothetical protein